MTQPRPFAALILLAVFHLSAVAHRGQRENVPTRITQTACETIAIGKCVAGALRHSMELEADKALMYVLCGNVFFYLVGTIFKQ